jgi:hypothetical protein
LKWGTWDENIFLKEDSMKKRRFTWRAFLSVFAGVILALFLVSSSGKCEPPKGEHPEHPKAEEEQPAHPEHPKAEEEQPEHPKAEEEQPEHPKAEEEQPAHPEHPK